MKEDVQIDESSHNPVPATRERVLTALVAVLLGFLLVQIIGFWMFPGMGWYGLFSVTNHSMFSYVGNIIHIYIIAFLLFCGVMGWFSGEYFVNRLKGYIEFWRFW